MLKRTIKSCFGLLVLLVCLTCTALAAPAESDQSSILAVDGSGTAGAAADQAVLTVGITTLAKESSAAQQENARQSAAVLAALKAAGLADADLETGSYSFSPSYEGNDRNRISGYQVSNSIRVTLRDVTRTGSIIDLALASGANRVNSLSFSVQRPEALRRAALQRAIADARLKADIMAETLGLRITGIKLVTENVGSLLESDAAPMLLAARANKAATPIAPGKVELSATVHIEYRISR